MTNDLAARVARIAVLNGIHIKSHSLSYVSGRVFRFPGPSSPDSSEKVSDAEILDRLREIAKDKPDQFGLPRAEPTLNRREQAISNLENTNAHAELTRPNPKVAAKVKLSKDEKEKLKRWGPGA